MVRPRKESGARGSHGGWFVKANGSNGIYRAQQFKRHLTLLRIIRTIQRIEYEAIMSRATAQEFQRKFGQYQDQAQREPVEITRHGRRQLVLMSADHYDWLMAATKRSHLTVDAPDVVVEAVRRAKMDKRHNHLNKLLK
jgi:prevent-host-death family protein